MFRLSTLNFLLSCAACVSLQAAQPTESSNFTIVDAINNVDGTIYIYQPQSLDVIVGRDGAEAPEDPSAATTHTGYRIQVFSDNNIRTAKSTAEHRKRLIEEQTELRAYVTFDSPYWRVRVGDFNTQTEADLAMRELQNLFPTMADDFRLVRERVNVVE